MITKRTYLNLEFGIYIFDVIFELGFHPNKLPSVFLTHFLVVLFICRFDGKSGFYQHV